MIGDDGLAHTASPPYSGPRVDGVYALTAAPEIDEQTGRFSVEGHVINVDAIWERQAMIAVATGLAARGFGYGAALATFIAGQAAAYSQEITPFAYNFAGTYQRTVPVSQATPEFFKSIPAGPLPEGDTTIGITAIRYDKASRTLKLTGSNFLPKGQSAANFAWTIDLEPRGNQVTDTTEGQPDRGIVWQRFDAQLQGDGSLTTVLPVGVALSQHVVGITRHILVPDGNGIRQAGESEESEAVEAWDDGTHKTIAATPEGIKVYGPPPAGPGKPIVLMGDLRTDEQGQALQIARGASQGVVYSDDGTLAYVAGRAGRIYVVDLDVDSVVATIRMNEADGLISALALSGNWLYVARTSGLSRIYADQLSSQFLKMEQSLRLPGYEKMTGFVGLAISDDSYLGVTARPLMGTSAGFVAFVDLNQIRYDGKIAAAAIVVLDRSSYPESGLGKDPVYITTGPASGQFILCNRGDYDQGIAGIALKFDDSGQINAATKIELQSVRLTGRVPDTYLGYDAATQRTMWDRMKTYHEDIQAASGAVVLDYDGETYAIVADFNLWFNDDLVKYWGTDEVPHTQIGGKVGVIKNPFGRDGRPPVYLGATTPIVGSAVRKLSLAADGTVYADVWNYQPNLDMNAPMSHSLYAWNAPRLIQGALTAYARDPQRTYPLDRDLPSDPHSSQPPPQIPELTPNRYDDIGNGRPFEGWINLGNYREPGASPAFGKTVVRPPAIVLSPLEPRVRLTAGLEGTGWDYVVGGINLLTGGYMERADQRMFKYHTDPNYTYDMMVKANLIDFAATSAAFVVSGGVAGGLTVTLTAKGYTAFEAMWGVGAAIGASFNLVEQTGANVIHIATKGADGHAGFDFGAFAQATLFGELTGGAFAVAGKAFAYLASKVLPTSAARQASSQGVNLAHENPSDISGATLLGAWGKTITTPARDSMTLAEAGNWFATEIAKIPDLVASAPKNQAEAAMLRAYQLLIDLREGAKAALRDTRLAATLEARYPLPPLERLMAEVLETGDGKLSGPQFFKRVVEEIGKLKMPYYPERVGPCFIAGTPVHTDRGLVPIEEIKVGDLVLSQPEEGGERSYKRVARTFVHEDAPIWVVKYMLIDGDVPWGHPEYMPKDKTLHHCYATANHPFWVEGKGWTAVEKLRESQVFQLANGKRAHVDLVWPVIR